MRPPRRHLACRLMVLAMGLWAMVAFVTPLAAQSPNYNPNQLKALFLFNFAKYTEWPKDAFAADDAPFVLGILGKDPFGKDLDIIKGKTVKGRKFEVKYFTKLEEVTGCQLLYIVASAETGKLPEILKALEKTSILTIAESDGFLAASGMINLVTEKKSSDSQSVGFEINLAAAQKAKLKLDAQLLKLAKQVKT